MRGALIVVRCGRSRINARLRVRSARTVVIDGIAIADIAVDRLATLGAVVEREIGRLEIPGIAEENGVEDGTTEKETEVCTRLKL